MLRIGAFAEMTGVTTRLLRHYEAMNLFTPAETDRRNGYRYYTREQVADLQQVLAYRAAGMPLAVVSGVVNSRGSRDAIHTALTRQRAALLEERERLDRQLMLLDAELVSRSAPAPKQWPFRVKRTGPAWVASMRRVVESYSEADALLKQARADLSVRDTTPSATIWHRCRPAERSIDCEVQVLLARPPARSSMPIRHLTRQLVVSFAHIGSEAELPTIYMEMARWSSAAQYRHCGPLREVYWDGGDGPPIIEVQFPVCPA
jgi:DNA-binding transcriptional MerR regulator